MGRHCSRICWETFHDVGESVVKGLDGGDDFHDLCIEVSHIVVESIVSCSVISVQRVVISWLIILVILVLMLAIIWSCNVLVVVKFIASEVSLG